MFLVPHLRDPGFCGRELFLRQLRHLLHHARAVALLGESGSGKTQLAVEYAHRFAPHHRAVIACPGQGLAAFRTGLLDAAAQLGRCGVLWLPQSSAAAVAAAPEAALAALRSFFARTDALLIVDDWAVSADAAEQATGLGLLSSLIEVAAPGRGGQLLVLARDAAALPASPELHREAMPPLELPEALTLLARRSGRHQLGPGEPAAAAALAAALAFRPGALARAADWVAAHGASWMDCLAAVESSGGEIPSYDAAASR